MTKTQIIITVISLIFFIINLISAIVIILKSKKFKKQKVILRLYSSAFYTFLFIIMSIIIILALLDYYNFDKYIVLLSLSIFSGIIHILIMQFSVCGITEQALFVNGKIKEWYTIYDYYLDKNRKIIIFSSNIKGGLTLKGLTKPLRYSKKDEEKLEKYLESHISKHFHKIIIR